MVPTPLAKREVTQVSWVGGLRHPLPSHWFKQYNGAGWVRDQEGRVETVSGHIYKALSVLHVT